ncbi:MAG TPA: CHAT domain-containing protein [Bryobacteraceae bacterium]|nr:CHAT domain-containing protein [Bryobacteraceae bacterium]
MAILPRCLCVILTLWMVWQSPSPPIRSEAPDFGTWWGTPESKNIARQADKARRSGDLVSAESFYKQGYDDAVRRHDGRAAVGYLNGIAACRLTELRYQAAMETLLEAKRRAKAIGDRVALGAIAVNLSSVYFQVYDFESSRREAEDGRAAVRTLRKPYYLPNLLLQLARLHEKLEQDGRSAPLYREGIEAARKAGDKQLEALGLDLLGEALLREGRVEEAEKVIAEGIKLREARKELGFSWGWMGAVKLAKGELPEAARYTDLALNSEVRAAEYLLKNQRGRVRLAQARTREALADLRDAVELASRWRVGVLPTSATLTAANRQLEQLVFSSFVDAAATEACRTGTRRWAEEAFEAMELNRSASLRESLVLAEAWRKKAPPEYWETLGKLRIADSKMLGKGSLSEESRRLRLELTEIEAKSGSGFVVKNSEIFRSQSSLIHFQLGLGRSEVLLSFHLGDRESYRWEVTRDSFRWRKIAGKSEIRQRVFAFQEAVRAGRLETPELGEELYKELFRGIGPEAENKPSWLLSLDGILFQVPFAALVTGREGGKVSYLVSKHSVQTIPGAMLLSSRPEVGTGWFLGVGDPIYNVADPRWVKPAGLLPRFRPLLPDAQFGRLVGSDEELRASAANWGRTAVLLEGAEARRDKFLNRVGENPGVIHLATHVVSSGSTALIAFGLGKHGEAEFLTTTDVATLSVPGAVVAMTGCDTGSGEAVEGAGLLGLTRAWEMAGASAVLATSWPVLDSGGDVLASFYKHLRHSGAAEALQRSQLEMLNSGTWRAKPSFWAAYQITGGGR